MMWRYSQGQHHKVIIFIILSLLGNSIWLAESFIVAKIFNIIQAQGVSQENLWTIIGLAAVVAFATLIGWTLHGPSRVIEISNAFIVRNQYKSYLLQGTLDLPISWHTDHHSGDTIDKIEKGTSNLYKFASEVFVWTRLITALIASFAVLIYFNWSSSIIVAVLVAITLSIIGRFDKKLLPIYDAVNEASNTVSAKVYDAISNVTTVIILRIEKLVLKTLETVMHKPYALDRRSNIITELKWFTTSFLASLMVFFVLATYFYQQVHSGAAIALGSIYLLYSYATRVTNVFYDIAWQYGETLQRAAAVRNAELIAQEFQALPKIREKHLGARWKSLDIQSLVFSYDAQDGSRQHLDDVSIVLHRGERIAIIGESGSGKTTFLKLLRGLYTPKRAQVLLDGDKLAHGLETIRHDIALIPQDPEIFTTTIRENITVGVEHTQKTIEKYADMACFTKVAKRLPNTWESSIVEKGVNLSGGEKQRLALARGLLACQDKSIILLDEPTSSVDLPNERTIYTNMFRAFKGKTIISTLHRLHLLPLFDTIYIFDKGKIVGKGSFQELLTNSKAFQAIWENYQQTQES